MSGWSAHLVLGSTGLALTVLATALVLRCWRRAPIRSYRLAVAVLAAALLLPAAQLAARGLGLSIQHPVRSLVASLLSEALERDAAPLASTATFAGVEVPGLGSAEVMDAHSVDPGLLALALLGQGESVQPERAARVEPQFAASALLARVPWKLVAVSVYGAGLAWALARTGRRLLHTQRLLARSIPVQDERVLAIWREVSVGSPLAQRVRLVESDAVQAPACFGLGRPAVVLPQDDDLARRRDVLACVLTHELVHLERRDGWVLLGEELLRAVFWFHPAAWWLVGRLERLREVSCDLLVVRRTGQRRRYAQALVEYAAWMQSGERLLGARAGPLAAVVPWSGSKGQLTRRIEMLLSYQNQQGGRARFVAPAAIGIVFAFLWSGQLALAGCTTTAKGDAHTHAAQGVATTCTAAQGVAAGCSGGACTTTTAQGATVIASGDHVQAGQGGHGGVATTVQGGAVAGMGGLHTTCDVAPEGGVAAMQGSPTVLRLSQGDDKLLALTGPTGSQNRNLLTLLEGHDGEPIGIVIGEADETLATQLGTDQHNVIVVRKVLPGSRAERDGLQAHDVILRVDGEGGNGKELIERARVELGEGNDVEVVVVRKGDQQPIVLRAKPTGTGTQVWSGGVGGGAGGGVGGQYGVTTDPDGSLRVYGLDGAAKAWTSGGGSGGKSKAYKLDKEGKLQELLLKEYHSDLGTAADQEQLGRLLRGQADSYYKHVEPEEFQHKIKKALEAIQERDATLTDEQRAGVRALRGYAHQDAREALERASKALQELSDRDLGAAAQRSMLQQHGMAQKWLDATHARAAESTDSLEDLKQKLAATRDALDAQRAQIEDLKRALEAMSRERATTRELR